MSKFYLVLGVLSILLIGCKSASKAYEKGNYSDAIELAVKKIQKDPYDGESISIAKNAYNEAQRLHEDKIRQLSNSPSEKKFEQIFNEYRQLQNLYELVNRYPTLQKALKPVDYSEYLVTYGNKAADLYFQKGLERMNAGSKAAYRDAYQDFRTALRFRDDSSTRRKMDTAYNLALVRVVVLPLNEHMYAGGYQYSNSHHFRNFENELMRTLRYNTSNQFVKFYSEWDARAEEVQPDEILELRLGRIDIGRPYDRTSSHTASKEVVIKEIVYRPDSVVKQYGKVTAQVTTTQRTMVSQGELYVTSRDPRGRILWTDIFRGEHKWETEFSTFRGDERALSDRDRALLNRQDRNAPREDEVMDAVLDQIENDMSYRVRNYYSRYL